MPNSRVGPRSVRNFDVVSTVKDSVLPNNLEFTSNVSCADLRSAYFRNYKTNSSVNIFSCRDFIIKSINSYPVLIIEGATGCGKTTQVPMYILEDAILGKKLEKSPVIYVTQPRRIAAKSIADRVCEEHGWQVGSIVGYQVGLDKLVGPQTVLVYCTAGVLLQKLITDKSLEHYTHIIIDEAHERDADTDLLMMMIRHLMHKESRLFHLIIMSATMDVSKLKNYFTYKEPLGSKVLIPPALCQIDNANKRMEEVKYIFFDSMKEIFGFGECKSEFDASHPDLSDSTLEVARKIIVEVIPTLDTFHESTKSTLVFLPGLAEIHRMHRFLRRFETFLDIIPLHSCIPNLEQKRVFQPARKGCRKVILATNIAESSITVKDVGFIIDFCLTKVLKKDEVTKFPTLKLEWSTKDKSIQRAGRTGRCCAGKVFRMVPQKFFKQFRSYAEPELLTGPLELSVLRIKRFQMGSVKELMAAVIDPPPQGEVRTAVLELKQIGALSSTYNGVLEDLDGDLTELGRIISNLPIDVHLSKLIVVAAVLDVLDDAIIVSACLSTNRTVVKHLYQREVDSYENKLAWARGSHSDLIVALDVYKEFMELKAAKSKEPRWLEGFCKSRNLDDRKLHEVSALVDELRTRLEQQNILVLDQPNRVRNKDEDEMMLKISFCAAFYPNYFLSKDIDDQEVRAELCGLDPAKTVVLHNFPMNSSHLYRSQVLDQFTNTCHDVEYMVDQSRSYIVFNNDKKVLEDEISYSLIKTEGVLQRAPALSRSVLMALQQGKFKRISIREYQPEAARQRMEYYDQKKLQLQQAFPNRLLPSRYNLVVGRAADNSRFSAPGYNIGATDEYYCEVEYNTTQDDLDRNYLHFYEEEEEKGKTQLDEDPIFKTTYYKYLVGPTSPIQMSFSAVLSKSSGHTVEVDPHSVNSILLNTDYQKRRRQLLVSATVSQTKKNRVLARDTTLLPNIRGLPALMAMLFAQYYRVVYNEKMQCICGAIFGIGWDENDKPIDREYEVELGFDVFISKEDVELINMARSKISKVIKFVDVQNPGAPQTELQQELRQIILALISKNRFPLSEIHMNKVEYDDPDFIYEKHNVPRTELTKLIEGETRPFLPIIEMTKNYKTEDMVKAVRENVNFLEGIRDRTIKTPLGGVYCLLCGSGCGPDYFFMMPSQIREHQSLPTHIARLSEFEQFEKSSDLNDVVTGVEAL